VKNGWPENETKSPSGRVRALAFVGTTFKFEGAESNELFKYSNGCCEASKYKARMPLIILEKLFELSLTSH
jgi:hypothetical protein